MIRVYFTDKNVQMTKNFKSNEFKCKSGSNVIFIEDELVQKLQLLRDKVGRAVNVVSGMRTYEYNKRISGAKKSQHLTGKGADIQVTGMKPRTLAKLAIECGFTGVGLYEYGGYDGFVHCDVRESALTLWLQTNPSGSAKAVKGF